MVTPHTSHRPVAELMPESGSNQTVSLAILPIPTGGHAMAAQGIPVKPIAVRIAPEDPVAHYTLTSHAYTLMAGL